MDLIDLYEEYQEDPKFAHLKTEHTNFVPGRGNETSARVMLIGEAPGAVENNARKPFVGPSGILLGKLLNLAGIPEETVFITNVVKYRPPGNRTPTTKEINDSLIYIRKEWQVIGKPDLMIPLGAVPLACVYPSLLPVSQSAGIPWPVPGDLTIFPMFHPAYALRNRAIRPTVEGHWDQLGQWLKRGGSDGR